MSVTLAGGAIRWGRLGVHHCIQSDGFQGLSSRYVRSETFCASAETEALDELSLETQENTSAKECRKAEPRQGRVHDDKVILRQPPE